MFPKCRRASMDLVALRGEMEALKMAFAPDANDAASESKGKSPGILASLFAKG